MTYSNDAAYADYLVRYERYLVEYARYQAQLRKRTPGWVLAMQGIGAGLQLADQAISVYEHGVEAKALANYYADVPSRPTPAPPRLPFASPAYRRAGSFPVSRFGVPRVLVLHACVAQVIWKGDCCRRE